jgi:4-hydroxy-tetrahydrodipicolinate reductase
MQPTKLAIAGASGRMGARLIALSRQGTDFQLVAAITKPSHRLLSTDAGEASGVGTMGLPLTFDMKLTPDVLIDFSSPAGTRHWLKTCRDRGIPMVIGTTGLQAADHATIDVASADIPILQATNMSLGVTLLTRLVGEVAKLLGDDYDIELVEAHHRLKKDAPSGTANTLLESILAATGKTQQHVIYGHHGDEAVRKRGQIGAHSLRMGDEIGRHTVYFASDGERLELTHRATNRDTFARGALVAARWLASQKPGRYTMRDVLSM